MYKDHIINIYIWTDLISVLVVEIVYLDLVKSMYSNWYVKPL